MHIFSSDEVSIGQKGRRFSQLSITVIMRFKTRRTLWDSRQTSPNLSNFDEFLVDFGQNLANFHMVRVKLSTNFCHIIPKIALASPAAGRFRLII